MEEIDLCWKLHRAGKKIYYSGKSTVYHLGAGTLGYQQPGKTYLNFKNGLSLIFKHLLPGELIYKLPLRILLDWIAAFHFLLKGEPKNFGAVLRAHYRFVAEFNQNLRKRKELQQTYPTYPDTLIYPGLIVVDYYLRGKKMVSGLKFKVQGFAPS
jgi:GT2 family glycosyltransferase